jgi:hypothetical protein
MNAKSFCAAVASSFAFHVLMLLLAQPRATKATGKGTIDVYAINDEYAAITDSNFDAILVVNLLQGGGIAGRLVLHEQVQSQEGDPINTNKKGEWTNPTGITSCDVCPFLILTSTKGEHMYKVMLPHNRTLLDMAQAHDFTSMSTMGHSAMVPYWPWNQFKPSGKIRMVSMKRDGSMGYVAHFNYGLFSMDPLHDDHNHQNNQNNKLLLASTDIPGTHVSGLTLTHNEERLLLTTPRVVTEYEIIIDHHDAGTYNSSLVSEVSHSLRQRSTIDLQGACGSKSGEYTMHFRDTAQLDEDENVWIAVGHKGGNGDNRGMALYRITSATQTPPTTTSSHAGGPDVVDYDYDCQPFAGDDLTRPGWVDGMGSEVRFSRPHSMTMTPTSQMLLITDIDNRALRMVNLNRGDGKGKQQQQQDQENGATNSHSNFGQVSTVSYDEDLWLDLYDDVDQAHTHTHANVSVIMPPTVVSVTTSSSSSIRQKKEESPTTTNSYSYFEAQHYCLQHYHGRVCSLPEIRNNSRRIIVNANNNKKGTQEESTISSTWTSQPCHSCWLRNPGQCDPAASRIESSAHRFESSWGAAVFMVAQIQINADVDVDVDGSMMQMQTMQIQTQCRHEHTHLTGVPICCATDTDYSDDDDVSFSDAASLTFSHQQSATILNVDDIADAEILNLNSSSWYDNNGTSALMFASFVGAFVVSVGVRFLRRGRDIAILQHK